MNRKKNLMLACLLALSAAVLTACGEKDKPTIIEGTKPKPANVFTNGIPKELGPLKIETNADGLVTKISGGTRTVTYEYDYAKSRAVLVNDVTVKITEKDKPSQTYLVYLNDKGFTRYCEQIIEGKDTRTWECRYNSAGQITEIFNDGGRNMTKAEFTYNNGDITETTITRGDEVLEKNKIEYGTQFNFGHIMFFYNLCDFDFFGGIDLDVLYYAGMLGISTKNLPVKITDDENHEYLFTWNISPAGYPVSIIYKNGDKTETMNIKW